MTELANFDGITYDRERDHARLGRQLRAVRDLMLDGKWRTLSDIEWALTPAANAASVSARLRDLRKPQYGGYTVDRRYVERGIWAYRLIVSPLRKESK